MSLAAAMPGTGRTAQGALGPAWLLLLAGLGAALAQDPGADMRVQPAHEGAFRSLFDRSPEWRQSPGADPEGGRWRLEPEPETQRRRFRRLEAETESPLERRRRADAVSSVTRSLPEPVPLVSIPFR